MIEKEGYWVPHELKPRDFERRRLLVNSCCRKGKRERDFSVVFLLETTRVKNEYISVALTQAQKIMGMGYTATSTPQPNINGSKVLLCVWWGYQLGVIYCELLKPSQVSVIERLNAMRLSRALKEKRSQYNRRHEKVILQHDTARPPHVAKLVVKKYIETLKWQILPHSPPYSPVVAPSDFHLTTLLNDQHLSSYKEVKNWIDSRILSKNETFSPRNSPAAREMDQSGS
nr:transposase [Hymenolepis microstoma]